MKSSNVILSIFGVFGAAFGWMLLQTGNSPMPHGVTSSRLAAALHSTRPVLVEFYADWCGPCRAVGPQVEQLAVELRGRAEVLRFNVDQNRDLAAQYGVQGIPCFIAFKNGRETTRQAGAIPPEMMRAMIGL